MRPIFLHSLWRSGSTYAWMKFRRLPACGAFYEPFNEALGPMTVEGARALLSDAALKHPDVVWPYFFEYVPLIEKQGPGAMGVPLFKDEFSYKNYFIVDQELPAQKAYIDSLIASAERFQKVPVLGFVRSLGRVAWFRRQYDAVNIVLAREPNNQFLSCEMQAEAGRPFFHMMSYLTLSQAPDGSPAAEYAQKLNIPRFHNMPAGIARVQLNPRVIQAGLAERFQVFSAVHRLSHLAGNPAADLVIDMGRLSAEPDYQRETAVAIKSLTGFEIDFAGMRLPRHGDHRAAASLAGVSLP
jgi:hypothetical protein